MLYGGKFGKYHSMPDTEWVSACWAAAAEMLLTALALFQSGGIVFYRVTTQREKLESEIAKHMARANWFFRKYIESPMEITSGTPCFCISSGTMADDENAIDSRGACNLALPILWLYLRWAA